MRTPLVPQMHSTECGAACLGIVLGFFGLRVPTEQLRDACGVNRDGSSAADIVAAGRRYRLDITGWRRSHAALATMQMPLIAHWEFNHFVVLEGFRRGRWRINDPTNGRRWVSEATVEESFTGIVLAPAPASDFRRGGPRAGVWRRLWPLMRHSRGAIGYAAAAGLLLSVPLLALPLLLTAFVDEVLAGAAPHLGGALFGGFAAAAVLIYALVWLQAFTFRKLAVRLSVDGSSYVMWHLLHLPSAYFEHRHAGDIAGRVQTASGVAAHASVAAARIAVDLVTSVLIAAVLVAMDVVLGAVVVAAALGVLAAVHVLSRLRTDHERQLGREQAALASIEAAGLAHMDHLRATAGEDDFFARWSGLAARELVARQRFVLLGHVALSLPLLATLVSSAAIFAVGGLRVMSGDMTVGALVGFVALAGVFLAPVGRFALFADRLQVLAADLQRIDDVLDARPDRSTGQSASSGVATFVGRLRLAGRIELRNVTFGYRRGVPPLIDDFSLAVEPGQRVAIVGPTGSGKSSLIQLINGDISPWSGQVLFDGVERSEVPADVMFSSVSTVDQRVVLFASTVRENLAMWNPSLEDSQMIAAASDAQCHDEIMGRDGGYDALIAEGGRNFSGGQRQRLEIARALASNPTVLLADEATSSLDALTEQRIDDALRRRGITVIMIAHRLSTIRDCDEIVVLDEGRVAQRGTHDRLMSDPAGLYASLVHAQ